MYSISIVRPQSLRSSWTAAATTIVSDKSAIERAQNSWLVRGSSCCGFGIIRYARSSKACCKRSGLRCRSGARRNPHLNPLPLPKGEASFIRTVTLHAGRDYNVTRAPRLSRRRRERRAFGPVPQFVVSRWNRQGTRKRFNSPAKFQ